MGRCSQRRAPGLVTREQIALDVKELGVAAGDTVMLHAAVGSIGWVVGGPDRIFEGIFGVLGQMGTLMMYAGWDGSPYDVTLGMPEVPEGLKAAWPPYDPRTSRAVREWGVLPEYLRTWTGTHRSAHPDSSFIAIGHRAEELTVDHPLQYGMGPGSPLEKLCGVGGKVLLAGSPLANVTLLHYAEHLADVPGKGIARYWAPIVRDDAKRWIQIEEFDTEGCLPWFGATDLFEAIVRDYLQAGHGAVGHVGAAHSLLFDAADLVAFAVEWIEGRFADAEPQEDLEMATRRAEPGDHRELVALLGAYEEETRGSSASSARLSTHVDEFLEDRDRGVFVAVVGERIVGMLVASRPTNDRGEVNLVFVEPEFRRRGILRELEADASEYLREAGCHIVELRVDAENDAARSAWLSLGYAPTMEFMERPL
jgi:aminoglycoside 3-N-acetyltransferase